VEDVEDFEATSTSESSSLSPKSEPILTAAGLDEAEAAIADDVGRAGDDDVAAEADAAAASGCTEPNKASASSSSDRSITRLELREENAPNNEIKGVLRNQTKSIEHNQLPHLECC
jgi:prophage DNA circulation protein